MKNERKIFLASSINEFFNDRAHVSDFVNNRLNKIYEPQGLRFRLEKCEDEDTMIPAPGTSSQDLLDKDLLGSDMLVVLCGTTPGKSKMGEYTRHEFDVAYTQFAEMGTPKISVHMKEAEHTNDDNQKLHHSVTDFQARIGNKIEDGGLGYFWSQYQHIDTLYFGILMKLLAHGIIPPLSQYNDMVVDNQSGQPIISLENIPAWANNDLVNGKQTCCNHLSYELENARAAYLADTTNKELNTAFIKASNVYNEFHEEFQKRKLEVFDSICTVTKLLFNGNVQSRTVNAYRHIEQGDYKEAKAILNLEELNSDTRNFMIQNQKYEEFKREVDAERFSAAMDLHDSYILGAKVSYSMSQCKADFDEVEEYYKVAQQLCEQFNLGTNVLFEYGTYLSSQNRHDEAMAKFEQELDRIRILGASEPEKYLLKHADTLNSYAILQDKNGHYTEAETNYNEVLKILRGLAETDPNYLQTVSMVLNNLGLLQYHSKNFTEAEKSYTEALSIDRWLVGNNKGRQENLVYSLGGLANLQFDMYDYSNAEANYMEALNIAKQLAENEPEKHLPKQAMIMNNLAIFQERIGRFEEAEINRTQALAIHQDLSTINPDKHLPEVAIALNNLASFQEDLKLYKDAERNFTQALEISRSLAEVHPNVYLPEVARVLDNLAWLYEKIARHDKMEVFGTEALQILRHFAEVSPEIYAEKIKYLAILVEETDWSKVHRLSKTSRFRNRYPDFGKELYRKQYNKQVNFSQDREIVHRMITEADAVVNEYIADRAMEWDEDAEIEEEIQSLPPQPQVDEVNGEESELVKMLRDMRENMKLEKLRKERMNEAKKHFKSPQQNNLEIDDDPDDKPR